MIATKDSSLTHESKDEESIPPTLETIIVGGGHCGLNLALWLEEQNRDSYLVLERDVILSKWKRNRWDDFKVNTPWQYSKLHGQEPDDETGRTMNRPLKKDLKSWEDHVKASNVKYREHCSVVRCEKYNADGSLFRITVESTLEESNDESLPRYYLARNVVACNGNYDHNRIPSFASKLPLSVKQHPSMTWKSSKQLGEGAVLIVGGAQSGPQIADLLADEKEADGSTKEQQQENKKKRDIYLCASMAPGSVRSYRGEDAFYWMDRIGFLGMTKDALTHMPEPQAMGMRYGVNPIVGPVKPISLFSLARKGVQVLGSAADFEAGVLTLKPNRVDIVNMALATYNAFPAQVEAWIEAQDESTKAGYAPPTDFPEPEWKAEPEELKTDVGPLSLSLEECNVTDVIWCTGWVPNFDWIDIPQVHEEFNKINNKPEQMEVQSVPGFFFSGFHWLNTIMSGNIVGFDKDHEILVTKLRTL